MNRRPIWDVRDCSLKDDGEWKELMIFILVVDTVIVIIAGFIQGVHWFLNHFY